MRTHYPRTPHLPWSPGAGPDDVRATGLSGLAGQSVVVTEKLDGENTTMYPDGLHARSLDSVHHPSRAWVKALHGRIAHLIPAGWRVCGENLFARHSLTYDDLPSWFVLFSVWAGDHCLGWDETVRFSRRLGVPTPPVLWQGRFDERALRAVRLDLTRQEGYVVRTTAGFGRDEFGARVAKWVRRGHVVTDTHWMLAPVVPNGRAPSAALWDVRSGASPDEPALRAAVGEDVVGEHLTEEQAGVEQAGEEQAGDAVAEVAARIDLLARPAEARLAGVLATMLHGSPRAALIARLAGPLGLPLARRVGDLVGLYPLLGNDFPDEQRPGGLRRLAVAVDVGVLHAVAASVPGRHPGFTPQNRSLRSRFRGDPDWAEHVAWSTMYAEDAGMLGEAPLAGLRTGLRAALEESTVDFVAAHRCWAQARQAYAAGRIGTVPEAVALTWRWRGGDFPHLIVLVGPSGSGKTRFAGSLTDADETVSLDDLRTARGSRMNQKDNAAVLREGLDRLDRALTGRRTVIWDATALNRPQRSLVDSVARRRDAWTTHALLLVDAEEAARRNLDRPHPVPPAVLAAQFERFAPPYPGEAHRTWYIGTAGTVADVAGAIDSEDP